MYKTKAQPPAPHHRWHSRRFRGKLATHRQKPDIGPKMSRLLRIASTGKKKNWLGDRDSNPDQVGQSHPSYH